MSRHGGYVPILRTSHVQLVVLGVLSLSGCLDTGPGDTRDPALASVSQAVSGPGSVLVPRGEFPAVVLVTHERGPCTGTLISPDTVLTAEGCVCIAPRRECPTRSSVIFAGAHRLDGESSPIEIEATVIYHPHNDFALLKLDESAHERVDVTPMRVAAALPAAGEMHTLVGYGRAIPGNPTCFDSDTQRKGTARVELYPITDAPPWLDYGRSVVPCMPGDLGAPSINARGEVVGIHTERDLSLYIPTAEVWFWLMQNACAPYHPDAGLEQCSPMCPCASAQGECEDQSACRHGTVCIADTGAQVGLPADANVCWSQQQVVAVYGESYYGGPAQHLTTGQWDLGRLTIGNDQISSLNAPPGLSVRLFAESGCWGDSETVAGNAPRLGALDNDASCVQVSPGVTVYAGRDFRGPHSTFPIGGYNHTALGAPGNDDIESMKAAPGILVRLCAESGAPGTVGRGSCMWRSGSVSDLGANAGISNLEVSAGVTVYAHPGFQGPSATFGQGVVGPTELAALHDEVSSLVVAPGLVARVCSESQGGGDCETFTGWSSFVGSALADRVSWIHVWRPVRFEPVLQRP